jgi:hypothetical protein
MITFEQRFDRRRMFQYVNDEPSVLHCHHYATLFTKVALEQEEHGGPRLLSDAAEEAFFLVLTKYFVRHELTAVRERTAAAQELCGLVGLGSLSLEVQPSGGSAVMSHAHVDEGWLKKWGQNDRPVNFVGQGYIAAACATIYDKPMQSYQVDETASIVGGADESRFRITREGAQQ